MEKSIGLVPTMGALHSGHRSLLKACQSENDLSVCSVFVNPEQFNNPEDLEKYPRTPDLDSQLLKEWGCDVLFSPEKEEMYESAPLVSIGFGVLEQEMEGKFRPGHFSGVALAVSKLFNIVEPNRAYFGQKDWQQFAIIRQLVRELKFNVQLHCVATLREPDGLALSSRNVRLSAAQRQKATCFYKALLLAKELALKGKKCEFIKNEVINFMEKEGLSLEYFEMVDSENLKSIQSVEDVDHPIFCIAGYVGNVRLIDNLLLNRNL